MHPVLAGPQIDRAHRQAVEHRPHADPARAGPAGRDRGSRRSRRDCTRWSARCPRENDGAGATVSGSRRRRRPWPWRSSRLISTGTMRATASDSRASLASFARRGRIGDITSSARLITRGRTCTLYTGTAVKAEVEQAEVVTAPAGPIAAATSPSRCVTARCGNTNERHQQASPALRLRMALAVS